MLAARELGWSATGIEPSADHSKVGRSLGLDIHQGYFQAGTQPGSAYDLVILSHVIEHIFDPKAFIDDLLEVLRPGGILLMITPNVESLASALTGKYWVMYKPVDHVSMVGPTAIGYLMPKGASVHWRTSEYSGEILVSVLGAIRDALRESALGASLGHAQVVSVAPSDQSAENRICADRS